MLTTRKNPCLRSDGTANRQCCGQNRPVLRIPLPEPFPRLCFELAVNFASDHFRQTYQSTQQKERFLRITTIFEDQRFIIASGALDSR
jgi:hypothetical protein